MFIGVNMLPIDLLHGSHRSNHILALDAYTRHPLAVSMCASIRADADALLRELPRREQIVRRRLFRDRAFILGRKVPARILPASSRAQHP